MKYKTEGKLTVGQDFSLKGVVSNDLSELFKNSIEAIDKHHKIDDSLLKEKIKIGEIDKSQSSIFDFEEIEENKWNIKVRAIYDVSFTLDSKSCNEELTRKKVAKLLGKSQVIDGHAHNDIISIEELDHNSVIIKDFNFEQKELDNSTHLSR